MQPRASARILLVGMSALLAACAAQSDRHLAGEPPPSGGDIAVSAVATPFLIALKIPLCAATVAIAAPAAAVAGLAPTVDGREAQLTLGDGVDHNCGPPWVLSP